jgi:hypothetical protein
MLRAPENPASINALRFRSKLLQPAVSSRYFNGVIVCLSFVLFDLGLQRLIRANTALPVDCRAKLASKDRSYFTPGFPCAQLGDSRRTKASPQFCKQT